MPSTYSTSLRLELMADGEQSGTWGQRTNANLGTFIEQAVTGVTTVTLSSSDVTLTANNGAADQSRAALLVFTGTLTANLNVIVPAATKLYDVSNQTMGAFTVTVKTAAGTGVLIPQGGNERIRCDGTNVSTLLYSAGTFWAGTAGGTANAITVTTGASLARLAPGMILVFRAASSNTGSASVAVDGLPAITVQRNAAALTGGEIQAGTDVWLDYDGTNFRLSPGNGAIGQGLHTIWLPAVAMIARTTNGPAPGTVETTTNKVMRKSFDFDTATQEYAQFTIAFPKGWDEGAVYFRAFWTATSGSGGVAWSLQGLAVSDDDATDAAFGTAVTVTDTLIAAGDLHVTTLSAAVTVGGTPAEGDLTWFQISRAVANAADTLGVDAQLLGVQVLYTVNAATDA